MKKNLIGLFENLFLSNLIARSASQIKKGIVLFFFISFGFSIGTQAQFLKKMAKKLENKLEPGSADQVAIQRKPYVYTVQSGALNIPSSAANYNWFKKGSVLYYKNINADPTKSSQTELTVKNVYSINNTVISEIEIKTSSNNVHVDDGADYLVFKCSPDSIYIDFTSELKRSLLKSNPALSQNELANTGFMAVPVNMVIGQSLADVSFSGESGLNDGIVLSTSLTNRKVEGKEKITTPAGAFDCIKISATRTSTVTKSGVAKPVETTKEAIWLTPKVGLLKKEMYDKTGKITNVEYLTSFKK
ncbi:MAG: hypothetical protein ABI266_02450 [Ginsengibacter sp.]